MALESVLDRLRRTRLAKQDELDRYVATQRERVARMKAELGELDQLIAGWSEAWESHVTKLERAGVIQRRA